MRVTSVHRSMESESKNSNTLIISSVGIRSNSRHRPPGAVTINGQFWDVQEEVGCDCDGCHDDTGGGGAFVYSV